MSLIELQGSQVNTSLLHQKTTMGVDDWLFILNVIQCVLILKSIEWLGWLVVSLVLHFVLVIVTRLMPNLLRCYYLHSKQADRYDPHPNPSQKLGLRPSGFGREVLC